jgi:FkbM family methyltransferase
MCELSNVSNLFIYCDGLPEDASCDLIEKVKLTRDVVKEKQWCKAVKIIERISNYGLAKSIISGVTEIVNDYDKVIVLEDDLILSKGFLKYMNDSLKLYESNKKVMHVSGYMFPVKNNKLPDTFFYKSNTCWGWATWKRAWDKLETNPKKILFDKRISDRKYEFDIDGNYGNYEMLKRQISGQIDSWAILWYSSMFINDGLALHPKISLVENIGHDGSGVHSDYSDKFTIKRKKDFVNVVLQDAKENIYARRLIGKFLNPNNKVKSTMSNMLHPRVLKILKTILIKDKRKEFLELRRLSKIDRYIEGTTVLLGVNFRYSDAASFLFMYDEIFRKQIYQFNSVNAKPYIIDCGANIGLSVLYFKKLFPDSEIIAFEPDKNIFKILSDNINAFNFNKVCMINKAVWKENTILSFESDGADGGKIADGENLNKVEAVCILPYLKNEVDLLKIDIEGAEVEVFESIKNDLSNVKRIFVEYHSFNKKSQKLDIILSILTENNFRYYIEHVGVKSNNPFIKRNIYGNMDNQLNIFAYKN